MWSGSAQVSFEERIGSRCTRSSRSGRKQISITWLEFLRSFLTVGYKYSTKHYLWVPYYYRNMRINCFKILKYRLKQAHAIGEFLSVNGGNLAIDSSIYGLDQSERVTIAYILGMVFAKFISEVEYDVIYLQNLDDVIKNGIVSLLDRNQTMITTKKQRPDFIGQDLNGDWVVFEAKGSLSGKNWLNVLQKAKKQVMEVGCINLNGKNFKPKLSLGSISIFNPICNVKTCDPTPERDLIIRINYSAFLFWYYKFIVGVLREEGVTKEIYGFPFRVTKVILPSIGLNERCYEEYLIGIFDPLFERLLELEEKDFKENGEKIFTILKRFCREIKETKGDRTNISIGLDGIMIGWV